MKKTNLVITMATIGALGLGGLALAGRMQDKPGGGEPDMGAMLMEGLKKTPGCLGVDAGRFQSGKNVIVAWFENKEAAKRWYHSRTHQGVMASTMGIEPGAHEHEPLSHVEHDGPVMVIAAITFVEKGEIEEIKLPISQISIEVFAPLPGGAHINGRLAPETFKVEHMKDYSQPAHD